MSGTPLPADNGAHALTITANNGILPNATQNFTLTISQAPAIASPGDGQVSQNETTAVAITQLLVVFNKSMNSADAQTLSNFTLMRDGSITVDSATYDNPSKTSTLNINGGALYG